MLRAGARKNMKHLRPEHSTVDTRDQPMLLVIDESNKNAVVERRQIQMEHEKQLHEAYEESLRPSKVRLLRQTRVLSHNSNLQNPRQVNPYTADYEYADSTITEESTGTNMFQALRSVVEKRKYENGMTAMAGDATAVSAATFGIVVIALLLVLSRRLHFSSRYCRCSDCAHQGSSATDLLARNECCESSFTPTVAGVQAVHHDMCWVDKLRRLHVTSLGSFLL